jgi:hypothetical protein
MDVNKGVVYYDITAVHADDVDMIGAMYQAALSEELGRIKPLSK